MEKNNDSEIRFYEMLRDVFIGAKIKEMGGESGYINLMKIKSKYFFDVIFPKLKEEIEEKTKEFP
ncbi:MAG: hypothetical protein QXI77_02410, partial [Nanopusillaceae archaeon]